GLDFHHAPLAVDQGLRLDAERRYRARARVLRRGDRHHPGFRREPACARRQHRLTAGEPGRETHDAQADGAGEPAPTPQPPEHRAGAGRRGERGVVVAGREGEPWGESGDLGAIDAVRAAAPGQVPQPQRVDPGFRRDELQPRVAAETVYLAPRLLHGEWAVIVLRQLLPRRVEDGQGQVDGGVQHASGQHVYQDAFAFPQRDLEAVFIAAAFQAAVDNHGQVEAGAPRGGWV